MIYGDLYRVVIVLGTGCALTQLDRRTRPMPGMPLPPSHAELAEQCAPALAVGQQAWQPAKKMLSSTPLRAGPHESFCCSSASVGPLPRCGEAQVSRRIRLGLHRLLVATPRSPLGRDKWPRGPNPHARHSSGCTRMNVDMPFQLLVATAQSWRRFHIAAVVAGCSRQRPGRATPLP